MPSPKSRPELPIESRIFLIRGQRVLVDSDLAALYNVSISALNQGVKRNRDRFPEDFLFQLTREESQELEGLRSHNVILKRGQHRKYATNAFTEQGIAMLASVLRSARAIQVNIAIVRTFVRLRQLLATHEEIARRLEQLEWRQHEQGQHIRMVFETIEQLMDARALETEKRRIGFPNASLTAHHG